MVVPPDPPPVDLALAAAQAAARVRTARMRASVECRDGLRYGPHPAHRCDLYLPAGRHGPAPLLVLFHGGGFRSGSPADVGYVAEPFCAAGVAVATPAYRLIPEARFPDAAADAAAAVNWLVGAAGPNHVDLDRLVVAGHSTGAMLAAEIALRSVWGARPVDAVVLVSGSYEYDRLPPWMVAPDSPRWVGGMIDAIDRVPGGVVTAAGSEEERPSVLTETAELAAELDHRGAEVTDLVHPGATHLEMLDHLADPDGALFHAALGATR